MGAWGKAGKDRSERNSRVFEASAAWGKGTVLRPSCFGVSERNFRVFEASAAWGKGQERFGAVRGWGKVAEAAIPLCIWAKVIMYPPLSSSFFFLIAEMEFRPIAGWPKRAYHGD